MLYLRCSYERVSAGNGGFLPVVLLKPNTPTWHRKPSQGRRWGLACLNVCMLRSLRAFRGMIPPALKVLDCDSVKSCRIFSTNAITLLILQHVSQPMVDATFFCLPKKNVNDTGTVILDSGLMPSFSGGKFRQPDEVEISSTAHCQH